MRKDKAFRAAMEPLEDRVVLSKSLGVVGALGDSYTDEYQFYPPSQTHARNWVEILSYTGKANFGPLSKVSRGEPRDQGFATNWARFGATSDQMVANQLPGLAKQVAGGKVKYVSIFIGGNDLLYYLEGAAASLPSASVAAAQLAQVGAKLGANIETAVSTLLAANPRVKLVVSTIPAVGDLPIVRALATTTASQALVAGADNALASVNAQILALGASNPRVAVADLASESTALSTSGPTVRFGGTTINLTTTSEDYHSFFLADGLHVGTVAQGIIADTIVEALDAKFHAGVTPLTPTQIVSLAKLVQLRTSKLA
jgi:hypothetical protein